MAISSTVGGASTLAGGLGGYREDLWIPTRDLMPLPVADPVFIAHPGGTTYTVTIPADVGIGDNIFVGFSGISTQTAFTAPAGWNQINATVQTTNLGTSLYRKVATAGDAGSTVTFTSGTTNDRIISVIFYFRPAASPDLPFSIVTQTALTGATTAAGSYFTSSSGTAPGTQIAIHQVRSNAANTLGTFTGLDPHERGYQFAHPTIAGNLIIVTIHRAYSGGSGIQFNPPANTGFAVLGNTIRYNPMRFVVDDRNLDSPYKQLFVVKNRVNLLQLAVNEATNTNDPKIIMVEIATGPVGAEQVIGSTYMTQGASISTNGKFNGYQGVVDFYCNIPANTRVAARLYMMYSPLNDVIANTTANSVTFYATAIGG